MKNIIIIFTLFICSILQVSVFSELHVSGIRYELLFSIAVFMGIKFDWYEGCVIGAWCGFLNDIFSINTFGLSVLTYSLAGFTSSFFKTIIFTQHLATRLLILFIMSTLFSTITFLIINGIDLIFHIWKLYKLNILSISAVNTIFAIPVYLLLDKFPHDQQN